MTALPIQPLPAGQALFGRYAYPPNELGYCGPTLGVDTPTEVASHAREFDGAWPYLRAIADAAGSDPLSADVVRSYWVGGPLLDRVDPATLLDALRRAFKGQATGLLDELVESAGALAHHSFHVFVVYPWVRFLDRDATTALRVLQDCRIRWGTVESIDSEHVVITSRPLTYDAGLLDLGAATTERVRWSKDGVALIAAPTPGDTVSAHWDWICDVLTGAQSSELAAATQATLDLVNAARRPVANAVTSHPTRSTLVDRRSK
ncbi:DUF6390 family protein [Mycobacterium hubeiense]|uniref:DUF6390 family protein n=1 Tax=Mycobacterium hubeiense TaxID=1867256 RepID=UPI000C7F5C3A|nr:DUF6390 family protein [Mycobacterium sp. QGD 101]